MGFFPTGGEKDGKLEIASANGEVVIDMKDGVQYILRFGNVSNDVEGAVAGKLNRYLFVSAALAPDLLTPPKLEAEPGPAGPAPAPTPPAKPIEDNKSGGGGADQEGDEPKAPGQDAPKVGEPVKPPPFDAAQAAIEKVRKENRRKMEDWEDRKKKATARVAELNARFADWYYVIPEDVYKKIHLSRADIIQEASGAKDEGYGIDAFRKLESDGIKQTIPSGPPAGGARPGGFNPGGNFPGGFGQP